MGITNCHLKIGPILVELKRANISRPESSMIYTLPSCVVSEPFLLQAHLNVTLERIRVGGWFFLKPDFP